MTDFPNDDNKEEEEEEALSWKWYDESVDNIVEYMVRNPEWIQRHRIDPFDLHPLQKALIYNATFDMICTVYNGNPDAIQFQDYLGRLPLHTAIIFKNSNNIIQFLLSEYRNACTIYDNDGKLPIHHAIEDDPFVDDSIIESLVDAYPESISILVDGTTVLNRITRKRYVSLSLLSNIVTKYPKALRVVDCYGNLPIHNTVKNTFIRDLYRIESSNNNLCENNTNTNNTNNNNNNIIRSMLQQYPEAATINDGDDTSLLEMAVRKDYPTDIIRDILNANITVVREKDCDYGNLILHTFFDIISTATSRDTIENVYTTTVVLITAYPESLIIQNDQFETPLHSLLSLSSPISVSFWNYAPLIVTYIINECPECLQVVDTVGLLPLHRICLLTIQEGALMNDGFLSILNTIVDNYPDGTRVVDNAGHLPIRIIVLLNLNPSVREVACQPILRSVLDKLLRTYPESIVEVITVMMDHNLFIEEEFYRKLLDDYITIQQSKQPIIYYDRYQADMVRTNDVLLLHMVCWNENCTIEWIQFLLRHRNPQSLVQYSYDIVVTQKINFNLQSNNNNNQDGVRDDDNDDSHQRRMQLAALTPLHLVCMNTKLLSTLTYSDIDSILKVCPEAATTKTIHCWDTTKQTTTTTERLATTRSTTNNGFLPIFLACQYDAPLDVIRCLLEYSLDQLFLI